MLLLRSMACQASLAGSSVPSGVVSSTLLGGLSDWMLPLLYSLCIATALSCCLLFKLRPLQFRHAARCCTLACMAMIKA